MARIELINVGATLQERARAGALQDMVPMPSRRGAAFAIEDLSLTVFDGETVVVLGPSGCGKTTLLKIIAGLIPPRACQVRYDGVDMAQGPPRDRRIRIGFQNH